MAELPLLVNLTVGLAYALIGGLLARRLGLPTIVGYLVAGVALSPVTPGFRGDPTAIHQLAEFGVILLMFGVGLHFSFRDLWIVRGIAIPGALAQMLVISALGWLVARGWGYSSAGGWVFGLAISVASTVVLIRGFMPVFPQPSFAYAYDVQAQIGFLRAHRQKPDRLIPAKDPARMLLATWNIANFGAQERRDSEFELLAEILSWFDVAAVQECRENFSHLEHVHSHLPASYRLLFTDIAGNQERMRQHTVSNARFPLSRRGVVQYIHPQGRVEAALAPMRIRTNSDGLSGATPMRMFRCPATMSSCVMVSAPQRTKKEASAVLPAKAPCLQSPIRKSVTLARTRAHSGSALGSTAAQTTPR